MANDDSSQAGGRHDVEPDPIANTQAFRAFAGNEPEPEPAPTGSRNLLLVVVPVAIIVAIVVIWLLAR